MRLTKTTILAPSGTASRVAPPPSASVQIRNFRFQPREVTVKAGDKEFTCRVRIDTPKEARYFRNGGILPFVLRELLGTA